MAKLKTFFYVFKNSLTSLDYYKDILKTSLSFSLKYFFLFMFILSVFWAFASAFSLTRGLSFLNSSNLNKALSLYPDELIFTVKNGNAVINSTEPFILPLSRVQEVFPQFTYDQNSSPNNFLVIDTDASIEDYRGYSTNILITASHIVAKGEDGGRISMYELEGIEDMTVTKDSIGGVFDKLSPFLALIVPILASLVFSGFFVFGSLFYLIYTAFFSVAVYIILSVMKIKTAYVKVYQADLHLLVISIILWGMVSLIGFKGGFAFIQLLILIGAGVFVMKRSLENGGKHSVKEKHKK